MHGRDREIEAVVALVRRRSARCVTITGPIGIGKTRLLEEVRRRVALERLSARFLDGAPADAEPALSGPDAIVVASPALLGALREREIALGALPVPSGGSPSSLAIKRSPSVALLADAAGLDLETLTSEALGALGRLAWAADGHPGVLEQIAGWLWVLSPADAARAVDDGELELLSPELRRRIRGALSSLDARARKVLSALAETSCPLDLAAAEAAVAPAQRAELPSVIASLVTSGWLLRTGAKEAPRWRVIAPFRPLLRSDAGASARIRLTAHYARLATPLLAAAGVTVAAQLREQKDEVVASWEDAHARRDPGELALAAALATIAWNGEPGIDGHARRLRATLRRYPRSPLRARLELALGEVLWIGGDAAAADAALAIAVTHARRRGDLRIEALAASRRAALGPELGRLDLARKEIGLATELARASGDLGILAFALNTRGALLRAAGDAAGALAAFDEEAELARHIGVGLYVARAEAAAADCHIVLGEHALGRMRYERALRAVKTIYPGWARTLEGYMGLAAWEVGALAEAVTRCRRALAGSIAPRFRVVFAAARAGALAELGEHSRAARKLAEAEAMLADDPSGAGNEAIRVASLIVALAGASDEPSRRAVRARIGAYIASHDAVVADDRRPFIRALERVTQSKRPNVGSLVPARILEARPRLEKVLNVLRAARGEPVASTTLFRAVWPGEAEVEPDRADARVRKAISCCDAPRLAAKLPVKSASDSVS